MFQTTNQINNHGLKPSDLGTAVNFFHRDAAAVKIEQQCCNGLFPVASNRSAIYRNLPFISCFILRTSI